MTASAPLRKIAVAVPSGDMVHADFTLALAGMCHSCADLDLTIITCKSSIVADARNIGVERAREAGADLVLFVDSDMVFPRTALHRLLGHDRDVVGATYVKRVAPHPALGAPTDPPVFDGDGLLEMARIPTGFLLIRMAVLEALGRPYFHFAVNDADRTILGEDYVFCDRARAAGYRIWCDSALSREMGHIGQQINWLRG